MTAAMAQLRPDGVASSPLGRFVVLQLFEHFDPINSSQHLTDEDEERGIETGVNLEQPDGSDSAALPRILFADVGV